MAAALQARRVEVSDRTAAAPDPVPDITEKGGIPAPTDDTETTSASQIRKTPEFSSHRQAPGFIPDTSPLASPCGLSIASHCRGEPAGTRLVGFGSLQFRRGTADTVEATLCSFDMPGVRAALDALTEVVWLKTAGRRCTRPVRPILEFPRRA